MAFARRSSFLLQSRQQRDSCQFGTFISASVRRQSELTPHGVPAITYEEYEKDP